jgi:hypothetical protein
MKRENEIKNLFKSAGLDEPSELFKYKVMDRIYQERLTVSLEKSKPLINKYLLRSIATAFALIILMIIAFPYSNGEDGRYSAIISNISDLILNSYKICTIIPIILSSAFILLLIDNYFNRKRQKKFL